MSTGTLTRTPPVAIPRAGIALRGKPSTLLMLTGLWLVLAYAAVAQGGFYRAQAVFAAAVLVLLATAAGPRVWRGALLPSLGLGVLAFGLAGSIAAGGWHPEATLPVAALACAAGAFAVGRAAVRRGERAAVLRAMVVVGVGLAAAGIAGVALHVEPLAMRATGLWRAASSITYANGLAAVLVLCLPAALVAPRGVVQRGSAFVILTGLAATASRGGLLAGLVLAGSLVAFGGRALVASAIRPAIGAMAAVMGLVPSLSGHQPRPMMALAGVLIGAAIALPRRLPRVAWVLIALAAVLALAGPARSLMGIRGQRLVESRVTTPDPREVSWRQALDHGMERPVFGQGPGRFTSNASLFAHNEYLQIFAETGAVGLASVLVAIGLCVAWAVRRRPSGEERVVWACGVAAGAAFLIHGGVDFVWRFPLSVILVFLWLAVAGTRPKETR